MNESTALDINEAAQALINEPEQEIVEETSDIEAPEVDHEESDEIEDETADDDIEQEEEDIEDDTDEEEADLDSELYTVKVDGEEKQVTLDDLKRGYSGQEYVQKGMKQAAEARKQAEEVYQSFQQARNEVLALANAVKSGEFLNAPKEPARELFDTDPIGYMEAKLQYDEDLTKYNQQMQYVNGLQQQHSAAEQQAKQAMLQQEAMQLKAMLPELGDADKASKWKEKITATAMDYGYSAEDLNGIVDHRAMRILNDAMKYRDIMSGKQKAEVKAKNAKPVIKAGSKRNVDAKSASRKKAQQQLNRSGKIEDAVSLIMNI